ncbi:MAG: hypothetical protein WA908_10980, partial [Pontixanthobacter sp.]
MPAGMTANIAAADVDPMARQDTPVQSRDISRRTVVFIVTGVVAYLIGMIALIPAAAIIDENDRLDVGGTIWDGAAVVGSTTRFDWDFSPL